MASERSVARAMVEEMGMRLQTAASHLAKAQNRYDVAHEAYQRARHHLADTTPPERETEPEQETEAAEAVDGQVGSA